ncbi:hypothetical protein ACFXTI_016984 [Malus domestica]
MATLVMSFIVILLFSLARNGFCACSLDNLNIGTYRSGREVGGKPERNVVVTNNCNCARNHIVLSCQGFQTLEPVDPAILEKRGDECVLIRGDSLAAGAWDPPVLMLPKPFSGGC